MLSAPAEAMLSSALFADFTRDVAARIIQHYWREHTNRRLTSQDHSEATATPQQGQEHFTEHEPDPDHNEAPGLDANQEESLADAMRRYRREDGTRIAATPSSTQQVTSSGLQLAHGHSLVARTSTASAARVSCCADVSFELAQGSMNSLDKLKQRQDKQPRLERPTAQHAKHDWQAGAELLPEAPQQDRSAAVAVCLPIDESAHHAQQAHCSTAQESSCAAQPAKPDVLTDRSRGLEQESSDMALLQMLNPRPHVHNIAPPFKSACDSTDGTHLQQQQQWHHGPNGSMAMHDAPKPQPGSEENVSPNLSPDKRHPKRSSKQSRHVEASAAAASGVFHQEPNPSICEKEFDHVGDQAADVGASSHTVHSSSQRQKSDRLSSNKLADIFAFLDDVEAQAEAEAADARSHAVHKSSLYELPPSATSSSFHNSSSLLHSPPTAAGQQLQHQPALSHSEQKVNRPWDSSTSHRRQAPAHEAAYSSTSMPGDSQATGTDRERKSSAAAFLKQTKAAHGQATSNMACTAETGSTGQ